MATPQTPYLRWAAVATLAVAVLVAGPALTRPAQTNSPSALGATDTTPVKGITVQGTGRITVSPDLATISVGVQVQALTAGKAQAQASAAMTRVISSVKGQGIADTDLTTQWISLQPQYDYPTGSSTPRLTGYVASQSLSVKVRHIEKAGAVIDAAVAGGATQVGGISFSVADPAAASAQARSAAVADARQRATALAQAAGVTLGTVISMSEVAAPTPTPIPYAAGALAPESVRTPVQVGTTEVEVDVQVTFAIGS